MFFSFWFRRLFKNFSSKFDCPKIENFGTISSTFRQVIVAESLGNKMRSSYVANLAPLNFEQKIHCFLGGLHSSKLHENCHTHVLPYKVPDFINKIGKMSIFGAIRIDFFASG